MRGLYPGLRCEQDHRIILNDPNIDAVVVATPVSTHYEIVRESLLAGKHVLCEKPLCKRSNQGEELVELARAGGRLLMVGHVFLFNPGIEKLKELLDLGELGTPQYLAASRANLGIFQEDVNVVYDLCSHDISIFNWLVGSEPEVVSAMGASFVRSGVEDVALSLDKVSGQHPGPHARKLARSQKGASNHAGGKSANGYAGMIWNLLYQSPSTTKEPMLFRIYNDFGEFLRLSMRGTGIFVCRKCTLMSR